MLIHTFRDLFDRNLRRLAQQIDAFPEEEALWITGDGITNSAGNLCLHLLGNLNEYIGRQLGHLDYNRHREAEFSTRYIAKTTLLAGIAETRVRLNNTFSKLTDGQLEALYPTDVVGHSATIHYLLVHLSDHLMYHLGQIDYHRRLLANSGPIKYLE